MADEAEILREAAADSQGLGGRIILDRRADRRVDDTVEHMEHLAPQEQAVLGGKVVNAPAQDVVFRDDLDDVESVLKPLQAMIRRAGLTVGGLGNRLIV